MISPYPRPNKNSKGSISCSEYCYMFKYKFYVVTYVLALPPKINVSLKKHITVVSPILIT